MSHIDRYELHLRVELMRSPLTIRAYTDDVVRFSAYLFDTPIESATVSDLRSYVMSMVERGDSSRSVNRRVSALRNFFDFLIRDGICDKNPCSMLHSLPSKKLLPHFVPRSKMDVLVDRLWSPLAQDSSGGDLSDVASSGVASSDVASSGVASSNGDLSDVASSGVASSGGDLSDLHTYLTLRNHTLLLMLYFTGIRRAELASLELGDIDFAQQLIKFVGKGSKERIIPLTDDFCLQMERYLRGRSIFICNIEQKALFLNRQRARISGSEIYRVVKQSLTAAGVDGRRSPHVLRHTFATHLVESGVGVRTIQQLLGHSSIASTQIYTHNTIDTLKESYNRAHPRATKKQKL